MDIDKRNRTELKAYFVKNAIPTQSNFAELIDAMLNQKDDGIVKALYKVVDFLALNIGKAKDS